MPLIGLTLSPDWFGVSERLLLLGEFTELLRGEDRAFIFDLGVVIEGWLLLFTLWDGDVFEWDEVILLAFPGLFAVDADTKIN